MMTDDFESPPSPPPPRHSRDSRNSKSKPGPKSKSKSKYSSHLSREVQISKALSRLLRHAAVDEKIPISPDGYVRFDHLLAWHRLKSFSPPVGVEEIVHAVKESDKQRFALKYEGQDQGQDQDHQGNEERSANAGVGGGGDDDDGGGVGDNEAETETETQKALAAFTSLSPSANPRHFFIRATQGHSMTLISNDTLLVPISLADEKSIPSTVVHGTFYGGWEQILRDGCLKRMARNHVHFATGPSLQQVLGLGEREEKGGGVEKVLSENKVISGMRRDAQILIYVDIRKALAPAASPGEELKWYTSENNVVLTPGMGSDGRVDSKYWSVVVEVKEGLGVLWRQGEGMVKELPEKLRGRPAPRGKGKGARGGGGRRGRGDRRETAEVEV